MFFISPQRMPYQFVRGSVICLATCACVSPVVPRMCSFLMWPFRVTPHIHRSILISFISIRFSCFFVVTHVVSHMGLLAWSLLVDIPLQFRGHPSVAQLGPTPLHFFPFILPAPTRFVISVSIPHSTTILVPRYLK